MSRTAKQLRWLKDKWELQKKENAKEFNAEVLDETKLGPVLTLKDSSLVHCQEGVPSDR